MYGILERQVGGTNYDALASARFMGRIGVLLLFSGYAGAQNAPTNGQSQARLAAGGLISSLLAAPVVGQPYSAVQVHCTTRTLADGSTVSHRGHHMVARDAEGRVHVELRMAQGRNGEPDEVMVFVMDPVAHTLTNWVAGAPEQTRNQAKIASVLKIRQPPEQALEQDGSAPPVRPKTSAQAARPQPIITTEDLGSQSIQGLEVSGERITTIVPPGRSGNSAPITKIHGVWTSPDLQLVVKQRWEDPRSGERTVELKNLSRADPDLALFRAPPGYEVKSAVQSLQELEEKLNAMQQ